MANKEQLRKIPIYCNEYRPIEDKSIKSGIESSQRETQSCEICSHYKDGKCDMDLVDKVLSSMAMELDLKE